MALMGHRVFRDARVSLAGTASTESRALMDATAGMVSTEGQDPLASLDRAGLKDAAGPRLGTSGGAANCGSSIPTARGADFKTCAALQRSRLCSVVEAASRPAVLHLPMVSKRATPC